MANEAKTIRYVGVDGCKAGWFSVGFDESGECYEFKVFTTFGELLDHYAAAELILVDIPIGLPTGDEGRRCDDRARKKLREPRRRSVFSAPTRKTLEKSRDTGGDYHDRYRAANDTERDTAAKGLSPYTFGIMRAIAEVDDVMTACDSCTTSKVREIHPELCFWALKGKLDMQHSKRTDQGQAERLDVLEKVEKAENVKPRVQEIFDKARSKHVGKCVAEDDILDALAAAVTARCGHDQLQTVPKCPQEDKELKRPMEMVYWIPDKAKE